MPRRYRIFSIVCFLTIFFDQLTKWWARAELTDLGRQGMVIIDGYFDFRLSFNTGSAFGLFSSMDGARLFLSIVGVGAFFAIVYILHGTEDRLTWLIVALGFVAGGAIGNVIDRILAGKVTDFVVWKVGTHEWPAFNIADAALCVGVGIMFLDLGRDAKKKSS